MQRDEILKQLRERIVAFAASRLSRDSAEDLAQDVLVLLQEKYARVTELTELVPLSNQILRFKMLEAHRRALRRGEYERDPIDDLPLADPGNDPATVVERKQRPERLLAAIDRFGLRCRQRFRWKLEGKGFAEIRGLLAVDSINTVYTWDSRCRKRVLEMMGETWD